MTGTLFLVVSALFGAGVVRRVAPLRRVLDHAEQMMWGLVAGWMLTTLAAYFVARSLGRLSFAPMLCVACAVALAAAWLWLPTFRHVRRNGLPLARHLWRAQYACLALVLILFAPLYANLFSTHMMEPGASGVYSGGSAWYDLSFHTAITTSFLHGQNFPPVYTPFPPAPLLYPFLPDFQTAILVALGMSLRAALVVTSVPLALAITGLFYSFARRVAPAVLTATGSESVAPRSRTRDSATADPATLTSFATPHVAAALSTVLFLLNGGLGFVYFFEDWRGSKKSLWEFWSSLEINYANMGGRQIQWTNIVVDMMVPQRTSLFGLPVALMTFTLFAVVWREWSEREEEKRRSGSEKNRGGGGHVWDGWRLLLPAGVLAGLLPLFHTHTYLAVGLLSGFLFLLRPRRAWLAFWTPAVLLALPHFLNVAGHVASHGFVRFQPGWRGHNEANWLVYWLRNVGLPTVLIVAALWRAPREWRKFYFAFVCLLAFSLLVVVSPNDYDNIKLMFYWHAATSTFVAAWLVRLTRVRRGRFFASALAIVLALICIASGLLAVRHESASSKLLFSHEELAAARFAREQTAPRSLFLTAPAIHQPVLALAGRAVVRGDTAWLWSHGYDFALREADVRAIYAGSDEALALLDYYGVDYVYLGAREKEMLRADQNFFARNFPVAHGSDTLTIYDARRREDADETSRPLANLAPREFAARLDHDPYQPLVEFPRAGFSVYRFYKVAFGRWPLYEEFMRDMKVIGRGVHVGADGWREVLENNKRALTDDWPHRADFRSLYDAMSHAQFVDALRANAGARSGGDERESLINALTNGTESRASILRRVAESRELYAREYKAAYVLAHYFGYLRRDPADPPDHNLDGYNFWLRDLERTGDYRHLTRVFIESGEYKDQGKEEGKR